MRGQLWHDINVDPKLYHYPRKFYFLLCSFGGRSASKATFLVVELGQPDRPLLVFYDKK